MNIIKRDNRVKEFDRNRIENAIEMSQREVGKDDETLAIRIADMVEDYINENNIDSITVEEIQDLVVEYLKQEDKEIAKSYEDYRRTREEIRIKNSKREKFYKDVLSCSNIDNDNANVNQASFSGRKARISDYEQKMFALRNMMSKECREAIEDGVLYWHDLSSMAIGEHNCLNANIDELLANGFRTRNGDVRPANSFATACQLVAVIFQCQSQVQYGGVGSQHLDYSLAPYVRKSFIKLFKEGYFEKYNEQCNVDEKLMYIDNNTLKALYPKAYDYAIRHLEKEGKQSAQSLYHNLNTLESRAGSQVPFTSVNFARDMSTEGQLVSKWMLEASLDGIGKLHKTSIFPISIFQYKKGVNDKAGTPNYHLKRLALESLSKRIYPNFVNGDWFQNVEDENDIDTMMCTMGCRTLIGYDRHTKSYIKNGRGNINPITVILPKLGLDYGIKLNQRDVADKEGFFKALKNILNLATSELKTRYDYCCSQSPSSAPFMYENNIAMDADKCVDTVEPCLKHGTNAVGILGMAECCNAMFGKHHGESAEAYEFALEVVKFVEKHCTEASDKYDMNISQYFSPSENLCKTAVNTLKIHYGEIEGVTDRKFLTNSIHIPVYYQLDAYSKLTLEAPFSQYGKAGCITYVELDDNSVNNIDALEKIIDFAMDLNIVYIATNFPIDTCTNCGYSSQINTDECPECGSTKIERLKRVTGYLTTDYRNFNEGKLQEVEQRVKHTIFNPEVIPVLKVAQKELESLGIAKFEI